MGLLQCLVVPGVLRLQILNIFSELIFLSNDCVGFGQCQAGQIGTIESPRRSLSLVNHFLDLSHAEHSAQLLFVI